MNGSKGILVEAFALNFQVANKRIKSALNCFKTALIDMIYQGILDTVLMESVCPLFQSDAFLIALVEKLHRHSAVAQYPAEPVIRMLDSKMDEAEEK